MPDKFAVLLEFLKESLVSKGFTITHNVLENPDALPDINGHKPDLIATYKNLKTVYGKVELPENNFTQEQWDRLRSLSDTPVELYLAFPEEHKMEFVLSLINAKLSNRNNIIRIYKNSSP